MAYTMVQGIGKLSLKMGVLLRGSVYEQKKVRPISQCIHNTGHLSSCSKMHLFQALFLDFQIQQLAILKPVEVGKSYTPQKKAL